MDILFERNSNMNEIVVREVTDLKSYSQRITHQGFGTKAKARSSTVRSLDNTRCMHTTYLADNPALHLSRTTRLCASLQNVSTRRRDIQEDVRSPVLYFSL